jgi:hypothetical protein
MKSLFSISGGAALVLGFSACGAKDERQLQNSVESKTDRLEYEDRGLSKEAKLDKHTPMGAVPEQPAAIAPPPGASPSGAQGSGVGVGSARNGEER